MTRTIFIVVDMCCRAHGAAASDSSWTRGHQWRFLREISPPMPGLGGQVMAMSDHAGEGAWAGDVRHYRFAPYRLRVVLTNLLKDQFRCPYCNESTALVLHGTARHDAEEWSQLD